MTLPIGVKYKAEFIPSFNQTVSLLSDRCMEESMNQYGSLVFDVADMGGDLPERNNEGRLPKLSSNDQQIPVVLKQYGGTFEVTNFEAFISQSNERAKMTAKIMARTNRRLDKVIISAADAASNTFNGGNAIVMTPSIATELISMLETNGVSVSPNDITVLGTPKVRHQLMKSAAYTSSDYVPAKPYAGDAAAYTNQRKVKSFLEAGWIYSPLLPGIGTATAKGFIFHRNALGCAKPANQIQASAGWDNQHHYHFASGSLMAAAAIIQQGGIIEFTHDDTAS